MFIHNIYFVVKSEIYYTLRLSESLTRLDLIRDSTSLHIMYTMIIRNITNVMVIKVNEAVKSLESQTLLLLKYALAEP